MTAVMSPRELPALESNRELVLPDRATSARSTTASP